MENPTDDTDRPIQLPLTHIHSNANHTYTNPKNITSFLPRNFHSFSKKLTMDRSGAEKVGMEGCVQTLKQQYSSSSDKNDKE